MACIRFGCCTRLIYFHTRYAVLSAPTPIVYYILSNTVSYTISTHVYIRRSSVSSLSVKLKTYSNFLISTPFPSPRCTFSFTESSKATILYFWSTQAQFKLIHFDPFLKTITSTTRNSGRSLSPPPRRNTAKWSQKQRRKS